MDIDNKYYGVGLAHLCRELNCSSRDIKTLYGYTNKDISIIGETLMNKAEHSRVRKCYTTNIHRTRKKRVKFEGKRWIEKKDKHLKPTDNPLRLDRKNRI